MKKLISLILVVVNLTGCVGVFFSKNGDIVTSKTDFSRIENWSLRSNPPQRVADKTNPDGSEMYVIDHERKWCGLTIWAIIPIPLWLPACHVHTEITYKDGKPINTASQWPTGSGFVCGLFVPFTGTHDGYWGNICNSSIH